MGSGSALGIPAWNLSTDWLDSTPTPLSKRPPSDPSREKLRKIDFPPNVMSPHTDRSRDRGATSTRRSNVPLKLCGTAKKGSAESQDRETLSLARDRLEHAFIRCQAQGNALAHAQSALVYGNLKSFGGLTGGCE